MPGDGKNTMRIHSPEELPSVAKKVFDLIELEHDFPCHVVSFRGKIGFLIDVIMDEGWIQETLDKDDVEAESKALLKRIPDIVERIADTLEDIFEVPQNTYSVLLGENTDPDGHELMFFAEETYVSTYKKLLHYLDGRIYKMLRRELQKIENQEADEV